MRSFDLSLVGMIVLALLGLADTGVMAQSEDGATATPDPLVTSYFTGRTVLELSDNATLFEATDPRMSGRFSGRVDEVIAPPGEGSVPACVFRGTARIENEDGAWRGVGRGFAAGGDRLHWNEHYWFTGEGDYEGLSAVMSSSVRDDDIAVGLLVEGVVFPGDAPQAETPMRLIPARLPAELASS